MVLNQQQVDRSVAQKKFRIVCRDQNALVWTMDELKNFPAMFYHAECLKNIQTTDCMKNEYEQEDNAYILPFSSKVVHDCCQLMLCDQKQISTFDLDYCAQQGDGFFGELLSCFIYFNCQNDMVHDHLRQLFEQSLNHRELHRIII